MGVNVAKRFLSEADQNQRLQDVLNAARWDLNVIVRLAAEEGYFFSKDDLETAIEELWGKVQS